MITFVVERFIEPSLGEYVPEIAEGAGVTGRADRGPDPRGASASSRWACATRMYGVLVSVVCVALLTVLPDAPLRDPVTGVDHRTTRRSWTA